MNSRQLWYVQVLAQEKSFSRAAAELNISQPSLSQYIRKIEREIGMPLFNRTEGSVRLTDAGEVYIELGRRILDLEHQMETRFSDLQAQKSGSVIIGASPVRSVGMMPQVARRFREVCPGVHLVVHEGTTAELTDGMEHGEYDLCIMVLPVNERIFAYETILEEELVLAVPADHPAFDAAAMDGRRYPAIDARMLDGQRFVMVTDTQVMQQTLENLCLDYGLTLEKAAVVKSLTAQIAMVSEGVGMALVPTGMERFAPTGSVTFYSFRQPLPRRQVAAIWRRDRALSQVSRKLLDVVHDTKW